MDYLKNAERWGLFEVTDTGVSEGNPFIEREIWGIFTGAHEKVRVRGFYDGNGVYKVRFMPSYAGNYTFMICGNYRALGNGKSAVPMNEKSAVQKTGKDSVPKKETACRTGRTIDPGDSGERNGGSVCGSNEVLTGSFTAAEASCDNHGPVEVRNTYHFAYADGTPYYSVGTTCYVWELRSDEEIRRTLETLKGSPFNKLRFCIFPKHYDYNLTEPRDYPYEGTPMDSSVLTKENFSDYTGKTEGNHFDFSRFRPEYFQHLEKCILKLQQIGIEADLILMHPYDRWGFSKMTKEQDLLYLQYAAARFSAYRNVWWSLANEYDLLTEKNCDDWEDYAELIHGCDPYGHPVSIHNCMVRFDHTKPWLTHASLQRIDVFKTTEETDLCREMYRKPIVWDEIGYEGNIQHGWGNLSPQELVRRFWEASVRGGYAGHGETYMDPEDILWWSHGGRLKGESASRLKLLHEILCETPGIGLAPYEKKEWDESCAVPEEEGKRAVYSYYLCYYGFMRPSFRVFHYDDVTEFSVRVIDTWNMTIEEKGVHRGNFRIDLPGREYMAVQLRRVGEAAG